MTDPKTDVVGSMRERIQIATLTTTQDALLGTRKTWTNGPTLFAQVITHATGTDEVFAAAQKTNDTRVDFRIRFREVSSTSEVIYRSRRHRIEGVIPDAHRAYVLLETKQIQENYGG